MKKSIIAIVILFMLGLSACGVSKSGEYFEGDYVIDAAPMESSYFSEIVIFSDGTAYMYTPHSPNVCLVHPYSYSKDMGLIGFEIGYTAKISDDLKTITFDGYTLTRK